MKVYNTIISIQLCFVVPLSSDQEDLRTIQGYFYILYSI